MQKYYSGCTFCFRLLFSCLFAGSFYFLSPPSVKGFNFYGSIIIINIHQAWSYRLLIHTHTHVAFIFINPNFQISIHSFIYLFSFGGEMNTIQHIMASIKPMLDVSSTTHHLSMVSTFLSLHFLFHPVFKYLKILF